MTVSMRVMSAGDGYRYLLKTVVAGDDDRSLSTPLTRYYADEGTPPGFWLGAGIADLGSRVAVGGTVSEEQLQLLLGMGRDPVSGEPLGKAYPVYKSLDERIRDRVEALGRRMSRDDRAAAVTRIEAEEHGRSRRRAVAGYDFTFSAPKSVSALWAVADAGVQSVIVAEHHAAVADVIALMERDVAATRTGFSAVDGAVAQVDVTGLIATAYDHFDSRSGDPQLHTHVVISNKVRTVHDGKWRSLDGRPMHSAVVAVSEHYNAVLADRLTRALGVGWEARDRGRDRNPAWEIVGVDEALIREFSSRSRDIESEKNRLRDEYVAVHGREPSSRTMIRLRAQATLATRPEKVVRSLAELTAGWRGRATDLLGEDVTRWASHIVQDLQLPSLVKTEDLGSDRIAELGRTVVEVVGDKRSTWRRWNLHAEASRQLMGVRFATVEDRASALGLVVDAAEGLSLRLTPPELAATPVEFQRADGTSVFRPRHSTVFSSPALLAAEDHLLELSESRTSPSLHGHAIREVARVTKGVALGSDQAGAVQAIAASARVLDVLVGPAGAGKTTAMTALRRAWESEHGAGSVVGLAPSAAAAQVLSDDLGIATENTAKWLHDHSAGSRRLRPGQLVIVDEASLAGTHTLEKLASHAADSGAKVLLVGDWAQLAAVDAGGAFGMLVRSRDDAPELTDVRRFQNDWEKDASLLLRRGDGGAIASYEQNGRLRGGDAEEMLDAVYAAWLTDLAGGRSSLMIAETHETVRVLNTRARLDRLISGDVADARSVSLHDGSEASAGDLVITRQNDRRLVAGGRWVKNGDRWAVTKTHPDGSISVSRPGLQRTSIILPAAYVAEHVDLGYAVTIHQAQGATVDTAHAVVDPSSAARESLYVSMTRGRHANTAYVITDTPDDVHQRPHPGEPEQATPAATLTGILRRVGAETSAHETTASEQEKWSNIGQLAAEYETVAAAAQRERWTALIRTSGLTTAQVEDAVGSVAFGPLTVELRRAEAHHYNVAELVPRLVAAGRFGDTDDIAAVLQHRLREATTHRNGSARRRPAPRLIAGLIPEALGPMSTEMRQSLDERKSLIEERATALAKTAVQSQAPWTRSLGRPPVDTRRRTEWMADARVVAAYRDRYAESTSDPLGAAMNDLSATAARVMASAAIRRARSLAMGSDDLVRPSTVLRLDDSSRL